MKKQLLIFLIAFVLVFTTACDKNKDNTADSDKEEAKTEESTEDDSKDDKAKEKDDSDSKKDKEDKEKDDKKDKEKNDEEDDDKNKDDEDEDKDDDDKDKDDEDIDDDDDKDVDKDKKDEDDDEISSSENDVDSYVETLDEEIANLNGLDYEVNVKLPKLKGKSKLAKLTNKEIKKYFEDYETETKCYINIDYKASIINDILSIKIVDQSALAMTCGGFGTKIIAYNFDVSDGKIKKISNQEIFDRMNLDKDTIKEFSIEYLSAYNVMAIDEETDRYLEALPAMFEDLYEKDELILYSDDLNEHFVLNYMNMPSEYGSVGSIELTLAKTKFDMAMLSKPSDDIIGVAYIDYDNEVKKLPKKNRFGKKTNLYKINPDDEGTKVYFTSFCENTDYIDVKMFDFIDVDLGYTQTFVKITDSFEFAIENKPGTIYEYKSILPEGMPNEIFCIGGDGYYGEFDVSEDLKNGYSLRYIYKNMRTSGFAETNDENRKNVITFNADGTYKADLNYWEARGLVLNEGTYSCTNDMDNHISLMPSEQDISNGASDYYLFSYVDDQMVVGLCYNQDAEGIKNESETDWYPID